jgi:hypothetical protein
MIITSKQLSAMSVREDAQISNKIVLFTASILHQRYKAASNTKSLQLDPILHG